MSLYPLESDDRYEIWGGEKLMMTPSNTDHGYVKINLSTIVRTFVKNNKLGKVYDAEVPIYLHGDVTRKDFRLADFTFVAEDRLDMVQFKGIYGAPDLLVEILSPGKINVHRDRVEKYRLYEHYKVREYWIVSPWDETIEIYHHNGSHYEKVEQSRLLQGIELLHEDIFE